MLLKCGLWMAFILGLMSQVSFNKVDSSKDCVIHKLIHKLIMCNLNKLIIKLILNTPYLLICDP